MTQTKLRTGLIMLIGALGMFQPFSLDPYLPNLGFIAKDLNVSQTLLAQNLTFLTLGITLGSLVAGPMSDAVGRKKPVLVALAGYVLAALMVANASSIEIFFAGRILQGVFASCAAIIANAMLRDMYTGLQLIKAIGISMLVMSTSWFVGPAYGSLLQSFTNWRGYSTQVAIFAALVFALIFWRLPDTMSAEQRIKTKAKDVAIRFTHILKDRVFIGLVIVQACISISLFSYLNVSPFVYSHPYNISSTAIGWYMAITSVCSYIGAQLGSRLSQRIKPQYALLIGLCFGVLAGLVLIATAIFKLDFVFFTSSFGIFCIGFGTTFTPLLGLAMASHPQEAGTAASLIAIAGTVAVTLVGPFYAILDHTSAIGIGLTMATFMTLGIIMLFAVVRPNQLEVMK